MLRAARAARTEINQGYYALVRERLSDTAMTNLTALLARPAEGVQSSWDRLKDQRDGKRQESSGQQTHCEISGRPVGRDDSVPKQLGLRKTHSRIRCSVA